LPYFHLKVRDFVEKQDIIYYLDRILELSEDSDRMRHDAALTHLVAISRLAKQAREKLEIE